MRQISFFINRHFHSGMAVGGHVVTEALAFSCLMPCAAVQFVCGSQEVWLTRDEAMEVGTALIDAARDG